MQYFSWIIEGLQNTVIGWFIDNRLCSNCWQKKACSALTLWQECQWWTREKYTYKAEAAVWWAVHIKDGGYGEFVCNPWWIASHVLGYFAILMEITFSCFSYFQVTDLTLARENQANFEEYLGNNPNANPGIDLTVTVLTTGFWPSYRSFDLNLPVEMVYF